MPITDVDLMNRSLAQLGEFSIALEAGKTVTASTAANPVVLTSTAHGYAVGDLVLISGFAHYANQLADRVFELSAVTTNTFTLKDEDGSPYPAETVGGTAFRLVDARPKREMWKVWARVRDEVLRRHPWNAAMRIVTWARYGAPVLISGVSLTNFCVVTANAHGFAVGDQVLIENIVGTIELNDRKFTVSAVTTNTFTLDAEDGTLFSLYVAGGIVRRALTPRKSPFGYIQRYPLPPDCLEMTEVVSFPPFGGPQNGGFSRQLESSFVSWAVQQGELFIDVGPTVDIRYVRKQYDPKAYDPLLSSALVFRLSAELAEVLTQSNTKRQLAEAGFAAVIADAKLRNAQEHSPIGLAEDSFVLSRF